MDSNSANNTNLNDQLLMRSSASLNNTNANLSNLNNNNSNVNSNANSLNQAFSNSVYSNSFNSQVPTSLADTYNLNSMNNFSNPMSSCNLQQQSPSNYSQFMTNGPQRVYEQLTLNTPGSYLTNPSSHHHHSAHHLQAAAAAAAAVNQRSACQINGYGSPLNQTQTQQSTGLNTSSSGKF